MLAKKLKPLSRVYLSVALFAVLGCLLGAAVPMLQMPRWQPLGSPPEKAVRISDSRIGTVVVETENGHYYRFESDSSYWHGELHGQWVPGEAKPARSPASDCGFPSQYMPGTPGKVVDQAYNSWCFEGALETTVVVLDDGTVWWWGRNYYLPLVVSPSLYGCCGGGLALVIGVALATARRRKADAGNVL